jgi:Na+/H+-dicarboxylate symporter
VERYLRRASDLRVVLACLLLGGVLGSWVPQVGPYLKVVGSTYVELLSMIVLPFLLSSIIFSLGKLLREGQAAQVAKRLAWVFCAGTALAAVVVVVGWLVMDKLEGGMSAQTLDTLGSIVGSSADRANAFMQIGGAMPAPAGTASMVQDAILALVPSNIFEALSDGDMLKALVFALLFGIAAGHVPARVSESMNHALETIYRTCQTLARWINLPLPLVLVCMSASQVAATGWGPILAMGRFVGAFCGLALLLIAVACWVIARRSERSMMEVIDALREVFALAIATNNITVCMPAMMDSLGERLGFMRARVELLVPLAASLFRAGAVAYFICATLFVAGIYERDLSIPEVAVLAFVAWMIGFASGGLTGVLTVSMVGTVCGYLELPFEAAFVLFVAVDPLCTILRTTLNTIGSCAAVALICPRPLKLP